MSAIETPLVVIGGGPGGYSAAFRAADLGLETIIVERRRQLGGVCLNVGCIPSKALLHVAKIITESEELSACGVEFQKPSLNFEKLRDWKNNLVNRIGKGLAQLAKKRKVTVLRGDAHFISPGELCVVATGGEKQIIKFGAAIIACGSRPAKLNFLAPDPRILYSAEALEISQAPKRLLIIGGGVIGLEIACIYDALGSEITLLEATDKLLPGCDRDLLKPLLKRINKRYEKVSLGAKVIDVKAGADNLTVTWEQDGKRQEEVFDALLVAVGRSPNSEMLDLQNAGVKTTGKGFIPVNEQLLSNVPNIFAIGDITPGPMLAHRASHQGRTAADVAAGKNHIFDPYAIPAVAYTDPEIAWAGLSEEEALAQGIDIDTGTFPWAANGRALSMGGGDGLTKIIRDPDSGRVLGAGICGPNAGELIAEAVHAIEMGASTLDLGLTIHPHPTLAETIGAAAEVCEKSCVDLYLR